MGAPPLYPALNASPSCYGGVTTLSGPGVGASGLGGFGVGACGCGRVVGVRGVGTLLGVGPGGCGTRCCLCAGLARFLAYHFPLPFFTSFQIYLFNSLILLFKSFTD